MSKLIVTEWNGRILTALMGGNRCLSISLEPKESKSLLGNIYIGKVKNVVHNINAAFLDLGGGRTGYYSLTENQTHLFTDGLSGAEDSAASEGRDPCGVKARAAKRRLKQGDEVVVQVVRDAVKTKDPVLTSNLNFTGKYAVLTLGKTQLSFSAKIKSAAWKEAMRACLEQKKEASFGIIVRTNAEGAEPEAVCAEIETLKGRLKAVLAAAPCRTCYSLLEQADPPHIQGLRDVYTEDLEAIVTDSRECFSQMQRYLMERQPGDLEKLSFYDGGALPLMKLYSLEAVLEEALGKRVWLKSGGYLVIEPTEALTVVDVNTGKYTGKKTVAETILKINLEAAAETARQLRLRNLSGIIVVDFIDMTSEEHREQLLCFLEKELKKDPVKTVLVDMTRLGLVEITRKKVRRPLYEAAAGMKKIS